MRTAILFVLTAAAVAFTLTMVGCAAMTPEQMATAEQVLLDLRTSGQISEVQYQALFDSLHESPTWPGVAETIGVVGSSVLASLTGIRLVRGPSAPKAERALRMTARAMEKVPPA